MRRIHTGLIILSVATSVIILGAATFQAPEAPIGLDNLSNGLTDQTTHDANLAEFAAVDAVSDGLGPLFVPLAIWTPVRPGPARRCENSGSVTCATENSLRPISGWLPAKSSTIARW